MPATQMPPTGPADANNAATGRSRVASRAVASDNGSDGHRGSVGRQLASPSALVAWIATLAAVTTSLAGCGNSDAPAGTTTVPPAATATSPEVPPPDPPRTVQTTTAQARSERRPRRTSEAVGSSVQGRTIVARIVGDRQAARRVLVVGCVHGDEDAGVAVTKLLRRADPPADTAIWLVDAFNPDGCRAGTRLNANNVDLNRNSPHDWSPQTGDFPPGPRPLSEPESQAINRLVLRLQPAITIWYHQQAALVDDSGGDPAVERAYAERVGLPFKHYGNKPGSITSWQNATFPEGTAFVVELPPGPLNEADVERHANAVLALARG